MGGRFTARRVATDSSFTLIARIGSRLRFTTQLDGNIVRKILKHAGIEEDDFLKML